RFAYFGGEAVELEAWICNDTHAAPKGARLAYRFEVGGRVVAGGDAPARVPACASECQGRIRFLLPRVTSRSEAVVRLALLDTRGRAIHDTAVALSVFPALPACPPGPRVAVLGSHGGKAARLVRALGLRPVFNLTGRPTTVVSEDPRAFSAAARVRRLVRDGAIAVLIEPPAGKLTCFTPPIGVKDCGMGSVQFVSRATGHPLVRGFQPFDFRFWYNAGLERASPLLDRTFVGDGWTPILTTGDVEWNVNREQPALACAEKREGRGVWRICNVQLADRVAGNPVAEIFARRLLLERLS
ncbi:MAG: hypothetical protein PHR35_16810, partial [Kiritimatiellae bacterium]|nr:hypothetical protein [Kiritimatiellia bacterium]